MHFRCAVALERLGIPTYIPSSPAVECVRRRPPSSIFRLLSVLLFTAARCNLLTNPNTTGVRIDLLSTSSGRTRVDRNRTPSPDTDGQPGGVAKKSLAGVRVALCRFDTGRFARIVSSVVAPASGQVGLGIVGRYDHSPGAYVPIVRTTRLARLW